jgi:predicted nucleotidyltransferase
MLHELLLQQLVDHLKPVHGLKAIVLGGSYASGSQRPDSDLDIGLYYNENQPLDSVHREKPKLQPLSREEQHTLAVLLRKWLASLEHRSFLMP